VFKIPIIVSILKGLVVVEHMWTKRIVILCSFLKGLVVVEPRAEAAQACCGFNP